MSKYTEITKFEDLRPFIGQVVYFKSLEAGHQSVLMKVYEHLRPDYEGDILVGSYRPEWSNIYDDYGGVESTTYLQFTNRYLNRYRLPARIYHSE